MAYWSMTLYSPNGIASPVDKARAPGGALATLLPLLDASCVSLEAWNRESPRGRRVC